jgi:hypothetical protein
MSIRPVYIVTLHKICERTPSTNMWKAFCLEFGDDIFGYGCTPVQALTEWENDFKQKSSWGICKRTLFIKGRSPLFYLSKYAWYEFRWLLQKRKPSENLYISIDTAFFSFKIAFRP